MNILDRIVETKLEEIKQLDAERLREQARSAPPARPFLKTLLGSPHRVALIAEVKKASPSQGLICEDFDPVAIANAYEAAGVDCISVLTDKEYFAGSNENLIAVKQAVCRPVLRKDFIVMPEQVYESRAIGADAILLIVRLLETDELTSLLMLAQSLGMDVLVEAHTEAEIDQAFQARANLVGFNHRDLSTFQTSFTGSQKIFMKIRQRAFAISESGIETAQQVKELELAGAQGVLIGTAFCRSSNPGERVKEIMGW